jgi:hypothetical protein
LPQTPGSLSKHTGRGREKNQESDIELKTRKIELGLILTVCSLFYHGWDKTFELRRSTDIKNYTVMQENGNWSSLCKALCLKLNKFLADGWYVLRSLVSVVTVGGC